MGKLFKDLRDDLKKKFTLPPRPAKNAEYEFGSVNRKRRQDNVEHLFGSANKKELLEHKGRNGHEDPDLTSFLGRGSNISTHRKNTPENVTSAEHSALKNWTHGSTEKARLIREHYKKGGNLDEDTRGQLDHLTNIGNRTKSKPVKVSTGIGFAIGRNHHDNDGKGHVIVTPGPMSTTHNTEISGEFAKPRDISQDDERLPEAMRTLGKARVVLHGTAHHGIYIGSHHENGDSRQTPSKHGIHDPKRISNYPDEDEHLLIGSGGKGHSSGTTTHIPELSKQPYHPTENPTGNWHVEYPLKRSVVKDVSGGGALGLKPGPLVRDMHTTPTIHIKDIHFRPLSSDHYYHADTSKLGN